MRTSTPMIGRIVPVYRCVLSSVLRDKAKVWLLGVTCLAIVGMTVGFRLGIPDWQGAGAQSLYFICIQLLLPGCVLVVAANGVYSEMRSEGTLVYLWLRPVSPALAVAGSWLASMAVLFGAVVVPLTVAGWVLDEPVFLPALLALLAYSSIFLALGMMLKRPMLIGVLYIYIWENVIGSGFLGLERVTVLHYIRSISAGSEDLGFADMILVPFAPFVAAILVLLGVSLAFYALGVWLYRRVEVP